MQEDILLKGNDRVSKFEYDLFHEKRLKNYKEVHKAFKNLLAGNLNIPKEKEKEVVLNTTGEFLYLSILREDIALTSHPKADGTFDAEISILNNSFEFEPEILERGLKLLEKEYTGGAQIIVALPELMQAPRYKINAALYKELMECKVDKVRWEDLQDIAAIIDTPQGNVTVHKNEHVFTGGFCASPITVGFGKNNFEQALSVEEIKAPILLAIYLSTGSPDLRVVKNELTYRSPTSNKVSKKDQRFEPSPFQYVGYGWKKPPKYNKDLWWSVGYYAHRSGKLVWNKGSWKKRKKGESNVEQD